MFASILGGGIWSLLPFWGEDFWVWGLGSSSSVLRGEELLVMPLDELDEADQQQQQQEEDAGSVSTNKKNLVGGGWVGWACLWLPFLEGGGGFWASLWLLFLEGGWGGGDQLSFFIYPLRWSRARPRWACWDQDGPVDDGYVDGGVLISAKLFKSAVCKKPEGPGSFCGGWGPLAWVFGGSWGRDELGLLYI